MASQPIMPPTPSPLSVQPNQALPTDYWPPPGAHQPAPGHYAPPPNPGASQVHGYPGFPSALTVSQAPVRFLSFNETINSHMLSQSAPFPLSPNRDGSTYMNQPPPTVSLPLITMIPRLQFATTEFACGSPIPIQSTHCKSIV